MFRLTCEYLAVIDGYHSSSLIAMQNKGEGSILTACYNAQCSFLLPALHRFSHFPPTFQLCPSVLMRVSKCCLINPGDIF